MAETSKKTRNTNPTSLEAIDFRRLSKREKFDAVLTFCKDHQTTPKVMGIHRTPVSETERILGQFLINTQSQINRASNENELHEERKFMDSIRSYSRYRIPLIEKLTEILDFCKLNNRLPSNKNKYEKTLISLLNTTKIRCTSNDLIPNEYDVYRNIMKYTSTKNSITAKEEKLTAVFEFAKKYGYTPRQHSDCIAEQRMGEYLCSIRHLYAYNKKELNDNSIKIIEELEKYRGINKPKHKVTSSDIFTAQSINKKHNKRINNIKDYISFCETNGRKPNMHSNDKHECKLANFASNLRHINKTTNLNPEEFELAKSFLTKEPK